MIDKFILHVYFGKTVAKYLFPLISHRAKKIDKKLFTGIIIIILHLFGFRKLQLFGEDPPCNCTIVESLKMANCTGLGKELLKVPWGCGNDIKVLIFCIVFVD